MSHIALGLTAIKATVDAAKLTSDLLNHPKLDAAAVRKNLHELLIHAVNAQTELAEAKLEMSEIKQQFDDARRLLTLADDIEPVPDGGFCVRRTEREKGVFNPYCPVCWGTKQQAVALVPMASGYYSCAVHRDASYKTTAYREEERRRHEKASSDASAFSVIPGPSSWMR